MNDQSIIEWLNSEDSEAWRRAYISPVDFSVSWTALEDGYPGNIAFASLKPDYPGVLSGQYIATAEMTREQVAEIDRLEAEYGPDHRDAQNQRILWEGFRWEPDLDPTRV